MLALAERYAQLKGTKVIAHAEHGDSITFILEAGPKLTMTGDQLGKEIAELENKSNGTTAPTAPPKAEPADNGGTPPNPPKKKGKSKK